LLEASQLSRSRFQPSYPSEDFRAPLSTQSGARL